MKRVLIIAGPNGAGKTTFARTYLAPLYRTVRFLNADHIAAGLSPFSPEMSAIRAGRIMLEEIDACVQKGLSFAVETTLSGKLYLRHIRAWRAQGYTVTLFFLSLDSVEIAVKRVAERVAQGGHDIPENIICRRFYRGMNMFNSHYKDAVDAWALYDNSLDAPKLIDWGEINEQ